MSSNAQTPRQQQISRFIAALERLDPAGRARLKRNAGRTLGEARDVHHIFFQALPYEVAGRAREEETYFLVATLFPMADSRGGSVSLGSTMHQVRQNRESASLDRRFQNLIDSNREQLPFRLRQIVRLAAATDQAIDWAQLLRDLLAWELDDRPVQLRWARDYFVTRPEDDSNRDV